MKFGGLVIWKKDKYYVDFRSSVHYIESLLGIYHFLEYIRLNQKALGSNLVLDIGVGSGKALAELASSDYGLGINFVGTVLQANKVYDYLGKGKVIFTSAETLRGIKQNSVAGIISVFGLTYSAAPEQAARRINEVLVQGGVLKTSFVGRNVWKPEMVAKPHTQFTTELEKMKFQVAVTSHSEDDSETVLAIKGDGVISAEELLRRDLTDWKNQQAHLSSLYPSTYQ